MSLSLFIMLLAFFIVLNTISSYEEDKASKVRQSLEVVFSNDVMQEDKANSVNSDIAHSVNDGDTFERLDALFQTEIVSYEQTTSRAKGIMMVDLPYEKFAKSMRALNQHDLTQNPTRSETRQNFFLPTLASLMRANIDGRPTRLEIYLNIRENPAQMQNQNPRDLNGVINEVGEFSALLEKSAIPQKLINIGIAKGDPKNVTLVFTKYRPFSPSEGLSAEGLEQQ